MKRGARRLPRTGGEQVDHKGGTTLEIPKPELPPGKAFAIAVRPLSSLGTSGKPIVAEFKV